MVALDFTTAATYRADGESDEEGKECEAAASLSESAPASSPGAKIQEEHDEPR